MPTDDFAFAVTERREHHGLAIETPLLDGVLKAKMDFSERPVILPKQELLPIKTPLQQAYSFDMDQRIPLMHLDENIAEKLSRWQSRPLVRDLYDLARVGKEVQNIPRLAELYVLKSHINWAKTQPNRRSKQPARALGEFTSALDEAVFESGDLVAPTIVSDQDRAAAIPSRSDSGGTSCTAMRCSDHPGSYGRSRRTMDSLSGTWSSARTVCISSSSTGSTTIRCRTKSRSANQC